MIRTTCPYCGVGCGVLASHADGVTSIKGDPDHPANFGRLCSKGAALGETTGPEDRLLYPQISDERASWDEALDLVARKFGQTIDEHGPDSVAFYVSGQILTEDYYVANKLIKGAIGSANIDTNSRLCMASSVVGHKRAFGSDTVPGTYEDLELADLLVLVGSNLAWCHPVIYQRIAAAKRERPEMKVIVIDPRRTATCELADLHLAILPDGDTALFNRLLVGLHECGATDSEWIGSVTEGFEQALEKAQADDGNTGLTPQDEATFIDLVCNTERVVTVYSQGVNQSVGGTDKVNAILNCHLATGRIGRPGMGPFSITGQPNAMGGREVGGLANQLAAHMDFAPEDVDRVARFWDSSAIVTKPGLKAVEMFQAVADGRIKAIWIMGTNPVDSLPEADGVAAALAGCPFVVVSDVVNETDTLAYADVVLPAAAWGEKDGTVTNSERRISRQRPFMAAPGEAKPDWWQICEVAKRMGCAGFDYQSPFEIFAEHARLSGFENGGSRDFDISAWADTDQPRYDGMQPFRWPAREDGTKAERFFSDGKFFTPHRRGRFVAVGSPEPKVFDPNFPMVLNSGRVRDHWHTMTRTARSARLSAHIAEPYCEIHPTDATRLGVQEAGLVSVASPHGSAVLRALITDRQPVGSVFAPMHWTGINSSAGRIDAVIAANTDPFSGQPASKNVAVSVTALSPVAYGFAVLRERPEPQPGDLAYWALAKCDGGWSIEFALDEGQSFAPVAPPDVSMADGAGRNRALWFDGDALIAAIFTSPHPVEVARSWAVEQLSITHDSNTRFLLGAGRPAAGQPDKGAIVCSCNNVGANEIGQALIAGCASVDAVGSATNAGTNCGSCRSEIAAMLSQFQKPEEGSEHVAPIAAE